jgi:60 kDa SS-A/Ro ribonucleoprotein
MSSALKSFSKSTKAVKVETPQNMAIPGREAEMATNNAGGVVFKLDPWGQLDRFLVMGTDGGTYYVSEKKLTKENAKVVEKLLAVDGIRVVNRIVEISDAGRAAKNDYAIFALAMAAAADNPKVRRAALDALPKVCRIGTHLFQFAEYVETFRGWGRGLRDAVGNWYLKQPVDKLAMNVVKYQQREGWSNRDLLRLSHPKAEGIQNAILKFASRKEGKLDVETGHPFIDAYQEVQRATDVKDVVRLIRDANLPREAIPTEFLNEVKVWEALLERMPMTAMIRNLGKMTSLGLIGPMSDGAKNVVSKLSDQEALHKARIHPMAVLIASRIYANGGGFRGKLTWNPVSNVVDALDSAFYDSFPNVEPTGKNFLLGVDCSGSMSSSVLGVEFLSARDVAAAMALVIANVEPWNEIVGFTSGHGFKVGSDVRWGRGSGISPIGITPKMRLDTVIQKMERFQWGGTDAALPMLYANANNLPVDVFVTITDNETWAGNIAPSQALEQFRQASGRPAYGIVMGTTSSGFTIADPKDSRMLDVAGFDANVPVIINDFVRG